MALASLPKNFRRIREVARRKYCPLSLGELMRRSTPGDQNVLEASRWLHRQLPVRYARRIEDFIQLPHVVVSNPQFNAVLNNHLDIFGAVSEFPEITSLEQAAEFRHLLARQLELKSRNDSMRLIADGYRQVRDLFPEIRLDTFLHDLFTSGIACNILMENCVHLDQPREGFVGVVRQDLSPLQVIEDLAEQLRSLTTEIYGASPEIVFRGNLDCTLDYIPRHTQYMIQELLKNAIRSTVERHGARCPEELHSSSLPPVVVELQKGDVHVIVKVSDQGGGMSKEAQKEAWQYGWTTAGSEASSLRRLDPTKTGSGTALAGFGFGLPLTRLHAQFFGGDVYMQAMPGHGTDMYLLLTHLKEGSAATEVDDPASVLGSSASDPVFQPIDDLGNVPTTRSLEVETERYNRSGVARSGVLPYGLRGVAPFQFPNTAVNGLHVSV